MATIKYGCAVVVHGGVGEPLHYADGCESAAAAALRWLGAGHDAMDAAALDGETINMDASVMDSRGTLGAVSSIKYMKNPVLVACDDSRSPYVDLACDGAIALFDRDLDVGIIAVSRTEAGSCSNKPMPPARVSDHEQR